MSKKKNNNFIWYILGGIIIIFIIIILLINFSKPKQKEILTEDDFRILSVSWQTYQYDYSQSKKNYFPNENKPIDWDFACESCEEKTCESCSWEIITKLAKDKGCNIHESLTGFEGKRLSVYCEVIIDGIKKYPRYNDDGSTSVIKFEDREGEDSTRCIENLDLTKDHTISFCCSNTCMDGEVCQTFVLPAKC